MVPTRAACPARDPGAMAPSRLSPVLAVEIPLAWRPTEDRHGAASVDPADERGESVVGSAAHTVSCSSSALRSLSPASQSIWSSEADGPPLDGAPSCAAVRRTLPPWACSLPRPFCWPADVFVIVRLERRKLVWINVTPHPTAEWIARQITEAFPWAEAPRYLIRDRDQAYGAAVTRRLRAMGYLRQADCPRLALGERLRRKIDRIDLSRVR